MIAFCTKAERAYFAKGRRVFRRLPLQSLPNKKGHRHSIGASDAARLDPNPILSFYNTRLRKWGRAARVFSRTMIQIRYEFMKILKDEGTRVFLIQLSAAAYLLPDSTEDNS